MSWKEKIAEWGGGDVTFLSEDGEVLTFIIVGDPELIEGVYKKKPTTRICVPIITLDGFSIWICGKRIARRLARFEKQFKTAVFSVVRSGEHGDIDATYSVDIDDDKALAEKLFLYRDKEFKPSDIVDGLEAAKEICGQ